MTKNITNNTKKKTNKIEEVSLGRRFLSYLIDWYVGALCTGLPIAIISQKLTNTILNQNIIEFQQPYGIIAGIVALGFAFFYFVIVPTYIYNGQTLGKKICKIKIVKKSNDNVTLTNMLLRQVIGIIVIEGALVSASAIWHSVVTIVTKINFVTPLMYLGFVVTAISVGILVFNKEHRAIHDYLGNTKVVMCS
ncbi:RDD family protein [Clostridium tarantellae]|uniref:RDD family protein n=1 Tax=Clostridium tarantellae TaxID=39493 RepID=A0A6I1MKH0_9CLOT|nr:RDD family protein [Clostridium tarantellae]MPQ42938.1 RDD family protein [Clostridium tarantellae]